MKDGAPPGVLSGVTKCRDLRNNNNTVMLTACTTKGRFTCSQAHLYWFGLKGVVGGSMLTDSGEARSWGWRGVLLVNPMEMRELPIPEF